MPITHGVIGFRTRTGQTIVGSVTAVVASQDIVATVQVPGVVATVAPPSIIAEDDS